MRCTMLYLAIIRSIISGYSSLDYYNHIPGLEWGINSFIFLACDWASITWPISRTITTIFLAHGRASIVSHFWSMTGHQQYYIFNLSGVSIILHF